MPSSPKARRMDFSFASLHPAAASLAAGNVLNERWPVQAVVREKPEEKRSRLSAPASPSSCFHHKGKHNILIMQVFQQLFSHIVNKISHHIYFQCVIF